MAEQGRWSGRNIAKDFVRDRIWRTLEDIGVAVGPAWSMIPNFVGADMAAWNLAQTPEWKTARAIKTNPDTPQIAVRLRALYEGKIVYAPVPYLSKEFPYLRLDPVILTANGVSYELAATSQGFVEHGEKISFEEVEKLDFYIVGSVAASRAGGRTGKGAGFADLETAIFRELGAITEKTVVATTVHSCQIVSDDDLSIEMHDSPLDMIATEKELIVTGNRQPRPNGVNWDSVRQDQYDSIPFLTELRNRMLAHRELSSDHR
jgi:5-formyltetrahydrofolate cyclo-ligase